MSEIESLLTAGADVNTKDNNDFTLLMSFVKRNDMKTVKILLEYGANLKLKDFSSFTALDYAIQNNNLKMVELLMQYGTDISDDNYMLAIESNRKEIVAFFDTFDPNKHIFLKEKLK